MIEITTTIKDHLLNALCQRSLGNRLTNTTRRFEIATRVSAQLFFSSRRRNQGLTLTIINHLSVDVIQASIDRKSGSSGTSLHLATNALMNSSSNCCSIRVCHQSLISDCQLPIA